MREPIQFRFLTNRFRREELKIKYHNNIQFRLMNLLRSRLTNIFKKKKHKKTGSVIKDLGCSIDELKKHIENQFTDGMTWENQGKWHIDHIKPICNFDLSDRKQFLEVFHYTNLRPLWAVDNLKRPKKLFTPHITCNKKILDL
jgi:hypothetical protein